jgi:hypothetical protein
MKPATTLIDALYRTTFRPKTHPGWRSNTDMRHALESARRFVLDDRMSAFMAELSNESFIRAGVAGDPVPLCSRLADSLRVSARLPHASIWIEYPLRPYQHRAYEVRKGYFQPHSPPVDSEIPAREGWLIQQHPGIETAHIMHLFTSGDAVTVTDDGMSMWTFPFTMAWMADDSPLPWRTIIRGPKDGDNGQRWEEPIGDPNNDISRRFGHMSSILSGIPGYDRYNVGFVISPLIMDPRHVHPDYDLHFRYLLTEWTGVLRRVWALLSTIDHLPILKGDVRLTKGFLARGRIRKYLSHHTITLNVPAKKDTRILARQMIAIAHRKRHEVRAHWRDDWRNPPSKRCNPHIWQPLDDNADLIRCDLCGGRQMHIHKHERGDAALGYVTHDYAVTHPTDQPKA